MLFGKRKKSANERVLDLKARVESLRQTDDAAEGRNVRLTDFLEGDDVLTSRMAPEPERPAPAVEEEVVDLEAELQRYIKRWETPGDGDSVDDGFDEEPPPERRFSWPDEPNPPSQTIPY